MANDVQFSLKLPKDLADKVKAYGEELRRSSPGPSWSKSDVVRHLLASALASAPKVKP